MKRFHLDFFFFCAKESILVCFWCLRFILFSSLSPKAISCGLFLRGESVFVTPSKVPLFSPLRRLRSLRKASKPSFLLSKPSKAFFPSTLPPPAPFDPWTFEASKASKVSSRKNPGNQLPTACRDRCKDGAENDRGRHCQSLPGRTFVFGFG